MWKLLIAALLCVAANAQRYGNNPAAGKTFEHDRVKLYYEVYGSGEPLLMIHGNGASISSFRAQIDFFRKHYKVIVMDSRDQGRSGDSPEPITYEKMAEDQAALLDHLKAPPAYVLGWSDGGIEALLLGMRHPNQVKKIASMAANLRPEGATPEAIEMAKQMIAAITDAARNTAEGKRQMKVAVMLTTEPHIEANDLANIQAPTLVLASDHDVIADEHTLEIYHHIPNAQLCIFPDATHLIPYDDPARFNSAVERFFRTPYVKKDRIKDMLKSLEAMEKSQDSGKH